ncbi:chitin synthase III catalytic subunit [Aspergillus ambiguus]|uniref:chitin synthase export chaperone n=1 Tax=Aspergillus ambiguus TaxID=176160 RepID=UPI003CCE2876
MGSTQFGKFHDFCRDSTLPVCNLFIKNNQPPNVNFNGCALTGIPLSNDRHLANLGSILLAFFAILTSLFLLWRSERKQAAVGRREMQLFLLGFIVIEICEIFSVGGFPLHSAVRKGFSAAHIASITATCWVLLLNALVGYQFLDDGTPISIGLCVSSALVFFIGTGYIALDTGFNWTGEFAPDPATEYRNIALYVLYLLFPLVCLVVFFVLETVLVIRILGELRPMCTFPSYELTRVSNNRVSLPGRRRSALRHWPNLRLCHQHPPVSSFTR